MVRLKKKPRNKRPGKGRNDLPGLGDSGTNLTPLKWGWHITNDEPVDPRDCDNYPSSPWCGGNPITLTPVGYEPEIVWEDCVKGISITPVFGFIRLPPKQLLYIDQECRNKQQPPPAPPIIEDKRYPGKITYPNHPFGDGDIVSAWTHTPFNCFIVEGINSEVNGAKIFEFLDHRGLYKWSSDTYGISRRSQAAMDEAGLIEADRPSDLWWAGPTYHSMGSTYTYRALDGAWETIMFPNMPVTSTWGSIRKYAEKEASDYGFDTTFVAITPPWECPDEYEPPPPPPMGRGWKQPPPPRRTPPPRGKRERERKRRKKEDDCDCMNCCKQKNDGLTNILKAIKTLDEKINRIGKDTNPKGWINNAFENFADNITIINDNIDLARSDVKAVNDGLIEIMGNIGQNANIIDAILTLCQNIFNELLPDGYLALLIEKAKDHLDTISTILDSQEIHLQEIKEAVGEEGNIIRLLMLIDNCLGAEEWDEREAIVPVSYLWKEGKQPKEIRVRNFTDLFQWWIKAFPEIIGQFETKILVKDSDPFTEGDQSQTLTFPNLAELLTEMCSMLFDTHINSQLLLQGQTRLGHQTVANNRGIIRTHEISKGIMGWLGVPTVDEAKTLKTFFNPEGESVRQVFGNYEGTISSQGWSGKDGLGQKLNQLLLASQIIQAVHAVGFNSKGNLKGQIKGWLTGENNAIEDLKKVSDDDLKSYLKDVENNWQRLTGNKANPFYGQGFKNRPRLRLLEENLKNENEVQEDQKG